MRYPRATGRSEVIEPRKKTSGAGGRDRRTTHAVASLMGRAAVPGVVVPRSYPRTAVRNPVGVYPVHRLNARLKALCSEKPVRNASSVAV